MKLQFELTDTFGGEANYSWVKRTVVTVPDGTSNALLRAMAREWAGWGKTRVETEFFGDSADTIKLRPRGLLQVLFITTVDVEQETTVEDVVEWADGISAALRTEYANRVTGREKAIAGAVLRADNQHATLTNMRKFIAGEPQPQFVGEPVGDLTRAMHQRDMKRGG